jgi:hypothetical protein
VEVKMKTNWLVVGGLLAVLASPLRAQTLDPAMAMNDPDQFAWKLFVQVNASAGGNNALFETWASDTDTFKMQPQFPSTAAPLALRPPVVPGQGRQALLAAGHILPQLPPGADDGQMEESRRNKSAFDFIVQNNLYTITGLRAAYNKPLMSFPVDAVEVKAMWMAVEKIPAFTLNRVSAADVPKVFHVSASASGQRYALIGMHVISKAVPNWTWATFEHELNPARCDILGCNDKFGLPAPVPPNKSGQGKGYPASAKTPALTALMGTVQWDPAFTHYCLKGSQTDLVDTTGLAVRVGNSRIELGFVQQSSCMTCHGRAAFDSKGQATSDAGFDDNGAPLGPIQPSWYWSGIGTPPVFEGKAGLVKIAQPADFVWSIPFCAVDDTVNPPQPSQSCIGK